MNKESHDSLFVAISPSHILNFEQLIEAKLHTGKTILINPGDFKFSDELWDLVILGGLDLRYKVSSKLKKLWFQVGKLISYKKFIKEAFHNISLVKNYDMYYCNLDDVLTNHIYQKLVDNNHNRFVVVEDGVLNYYYPKRDLSVLKRKKLLSSLLNLDFKIYPGHPTNVESDRIIKQYVRLPKKAIASPKSKMLPFKSIYYQELDDLILIIGQDIMHNTALGEEYYAERITKLFNCIAELEGNKKKVVYKPHRNGNIEIAKDILKGIFSSYELFNELTPIENCLELISPKSIYSFESSAMLNIKLSLKNERVRMGVLPFYEYGTSLILLYKELGIEILE